MIPMTPILIQTMVVSTDLSCSRMMDPDMVLRSSLSLDTMMDLVVA